MCSEKYLAVHRKDADAGAHDEVDEIALTLGEVLIAPVAEGRHGKAPGSFLVTLEKKRITNIPSVYFCYNFQE